jgi:hypothetical protein
VLTHHSLVTLIHYRHGVGWNGAWPLNTLPSMPWIHMWSVTFAFVGQKAPPWTQMTVQRAHTGVPWAPRPLAVNLERHITSNHARKEVSQMPLQVQRRSRTRLLAGGLCTQGRSQELSIYRGAMDQKNRISSHMNLLLVT